jgi:hypothetical protein
MMLFRNIQITMVNISKEIKYLIQNYKDISTVIIQIENIL